MKKYAIKKEDEDFYFFNKDKITIKGKRIKKLAHDKHNRLAFFKYQAVGYDVSESCSEKMCYEISKILNYDCAYIELAKDCNGELGILNYLFVDIGKNEHTDIVSYLNKDNNQRSEYYTISNIKKCLDELDKKLFKDFIKIMIFDALVGEQDRHEENWGIIKTNNKYRVSPLYDNGCSLLKDFKNSSFLEKFSSGNKKIDIYINKSKTIIYKEDKKTQYKHFELIRYLNDNYHDFVQEEILNLRKLTDELIEEVVNKVPKELLTKKHREYIIEYLKKRRDILLNIK